MQTQVSAETAPANQLDWCVEYQTSERKVKVKFFTERGSHGTWNTPPSGAAEFCNELRESGCGSFRLAKTAKLKNGKLPDYKPRIPKIAPCSESRRSTLEVIGGYMQWAQAKGLQSVHVYPRKNGKWHTSELQAKAYNMRRVTVDPADFV